MAINIIDPTVPGQAHVERYWPATGVSAEPLPRFPCPRIAPQLSARDACLFGTAGPVLIS
jgi:hypothetical protein